MVEVAAVVVVDMVGGRACSCFVATADGLRLEDRRRARPGGREEDVLVMVPVVVPDDVNRDGVVSNDACPTARSVVPEPLCIHSSFVPQT